MCERADLLASLRARRASDFTVDELRKLLDPDVTLSELRVVSASRNVRMTERVRHPYLPKKLPRRF